MGRDYRTIDAECSNTTNATAHNKVLCVFFFFGSIIGISASAVVAHCQHHYD